jgi:signal transduction histidine kinase
MSEDPRDDDDRRLRRRPRDTIFWRRLVRTDLPRWKVVLLGLSLLAMVSLLDYVTGTEFSISPLYLLPAAVAAWWGGFRMGAIMSALCTIAWALADFQEGRSRTIAIYGESVLRCGFYCVFAWALAALREAGRTLQATVDARTAALQSLAAELSAAEDAQRRQVAYDIHDAISQNLSLLKLRLEGLRGSEQENPATTSDNGARRSTGGGGRGREGREFHHWLEHEIRLVDDLIRQTRTLSFELYPPVLDDLGLTPALQGYADQMRGRVGAEVMVMEQGEGPPRLETSLAHFVFRAIKELVGNALRHGKAGQVIVSLHWREGGLRVVVDDDGGGFRAADAAAADPPPSARRGLGLAGIRQRIAALGGAAQIESRPGEGTRAILEIPIASPARQPASPPSA